ncbi:MAG: nucleotidyl transferase AbiEii/AbiGii toxin family protein [Niabella sp.]
MISASSIRSKLYNIAQKENIAFQVIATRYFHERLLYRLSISSYAKYFYLKGGNFLYATQGFLTRPTIDIDLLGNQISNDVEQVKETFAAIAAIPCEDAVKFHTDTIKAQSITENSEYNGIRITFIAALDTIRQSIQIDVGFGDIVTPRPIKVKFPVLLPDIPAPHLLAYTVETVIAEKFQTMIFLGVINSRMKDFYDVYHLLTTQDINMKTLEQSVKVTFKNRDTQLSAEHSIFSEAFRNDPARIKMWAAFLKKIKSDSNISFPEVMKVITEKLLPIYMQYIA